MAKLTRATASERKRLAKVANEKLKLSVAALNAVAIALWISAVVFPVVRDGSFGVLFEWKTPAWIPDRNGHTFRRTHSLEPIARGGLKLTELPLSPLIIACLIAAILYGIVEFDDYRYKKKIAELDKIDRLAEERVHRS